MPLINIKDLKGVTQDNRKVKDGYLFAALQGVYADGKNYINDAITRGASVILSDKEAIIDANVKSIIVENPRQTFSYIVSEFYKDQPEHIIAVTGTNGKSSVVHFIYQLWQSINVNGAFIGTLSGSMTTPDPVSLHEKLKEFTQDKVTNIALEASSHGLSQYRIDGVHIDVAAFTSFSQDHLDYHENIDDYFTSKSRLFSEVLKPEGVAILNADIPEYEELKDIVNKQMSSRGNSRDLKISPLPTVGRDDEVVRISSYGKNGEDIKLISVSSEQSSQLIEIEVFGEAYSVNLPLTGYFQAMNVLCALACVLVQFPEKTEELVASLSNLKGVTGRMQHIRDNIYVDYAHSPDALENVLKALRIHTKGKLICVFGCGGDRDCKKRPLMGAIASSLADIIIVTDDNPRSENPNNIRKEILSGRDDKAHNIHEISDRREAIKFAVNLMRDKDILLIAGKGHEQGQIFDGHTEPFDDAFEVNNIFKGLSK